MERWTTASVSLHRERTSNPYVVVLPVTTDQIFFITHIRGTCRVVFSDMLTENEVLAVATRTWLLLWAGHTPSPRWRRSKGQVLEAFDLAFEGSLTGIQTAEIDPPL